MIGQLWDDNQLHDPARHRAPRHVQHRRRRVALVVLAALALLGASNPLPKQEDPAPSAPILFADGAIISAPELTPAAVEDRTDERAQRHARPLANASIPAATKPAPVVPRPAQPAARPSTSKAETAVRYALAQLGDRYVWAAAGPNSFDCSGLVLAAYARVGIRLGHWTGWQIHAGRPVPRAQVRRGDLVFPTSGHVGIALDSRTMVHASSSKGRVVIGPIYSFYAARRVVP